MKAFVVFATVLAAASANPQVLLQNGLWGGAITYNAAAHGLAGHTVVSAPVAYNAPAVTYSAPAVTYSAPAVIAPAVTKTQYHAQDEAGAASYGYAHPGQAHAAVRDHAGNVRGSYAYVNPEGKEVRVEYVADGAGFRVASNALPVAPVAPQVAALVGPAPVQETPEVVQARAAHAQAHLEVRSRQKRGVVTSAAVIPSTLGYTNVVGHPVSTLGYSSVVGHPVSTLGYSSVVGHPVSTFGYSTAVTHPYNTVAVGSQYVASPVAYTSVAAPVSHVREATLTKVVNTPGHAVSYRVD